MSLPIRKPSECWGGSNFGRPLYKHPEMPEWARIAAERMEHMGVEYIRINQIIQEMSNAKRYPKMMIDGVEYEIIVD